MNPGQLSILTIFIYFLLLHDTYSTLQKSDRMRPKRVKRPPGVAYDNKNLPEDCHVCRLVSEEIAQKLEEEEQVDADELKIRMRKERRTGKKSNEAKNKLHDAMKEICKTMNSYIPQDNKGKFRYVKKEVLEDTMTLIMSSSDPSGSAKLKGVFEKYIHPETTRLQTQCREFISVYKDDIMEWEKERKINQTLTSFICADRMLKDDHKSSYCLDEEMAKDALWSKTFARILADNTHARRNEL